MMKKITLGEKILRIKDCRGISSVRGLMFDSLKDKDGALIYANNIWMPFCQPLDIYFLDKNFVVLERMDAIPITLHPKTWKTYKNKKARYCLELRKGSAQIKKGQRIRLA
jgi:uncharacterized membrane protein (UPF0127 family)